MPDHRSSSDEWHVFWPGEHAPTAGTWVCTAHCHHQWHSRLAGEPFPRLPERCSASGWRPDVVPALTRPQPVR